MKGLTLPVLAILVAWCSALNGQKAKPFERVETFPAGEQDSGLGSLIPKNVNTVTVDVSAPYAAVWPAVKAVAKRFDKVGNRPVVAIDEQSGRVQNGRITSDALIGSGGGLSASWADEFVTEATKLTATSTRLSVTRKLVQKGGLGSTSSHWETRNSNGKLERWLITEVLKELSAPHTPEITRDAAATTYVAKDDNTIYIDLNSDGSFFLDQLGKQYQGHYTITGEDLMLTFGNTAPRKGGRLVGDSLFMPNGKECVRTKGPKLAVSVSEAGKNGGDTSFTNADIIKLVEAKLPDSAIISKIKFSACNFDVSTDGLIKLKQANVSDAVVQAVVDCKH
jgi:hypothetical protein